MKVRNKINIKIMSLILIGMLFLQGGMPFVYATDTNATSSNKANVKVESIKSNFGRVEIKVESTYDTSNITGIKVNDIEYQKSVFSVSSVWDQNKYFISSFDDKIIQITPLEANSKLEIITTEGTTKINVENKEPNGSFRFTQEDVSEDKTSDNEQKTQDDTEQNTENNQEEFSVKDATSMFGNQLELTITPKSMAEQISGYRVNSKIEELKTSKYSAWADGYYIDSSQGKLYSYIPHENDTITFTLKSGKTVSYRYIGRNNIERINEEEAQIKELKVRLVGTFEAAVERQAKYDGVSGASSSASANKNSDVRLEVAEVVQGNEPTESDWQPLHQIKSISIDLEKTKFNLSEDSGMTPVYSTFDSSVTLNGTPKQAGKYSVSVTLVDNAGRKAYSNSLPFNVYRTDELLIDHLKTENANKMVDGKYIWDMEPWYISRFDGSEEVVIVPKDIKAWYGSHTSGTYGELGYAVSDKPTQTLVLEEGTDLTLVNMKMKSSVKVVVKQGATLRVMDSVIDGNVIVESGGKFQMNYDNFAKKFVTGASISGQLILEDGAIVENSMIYSNTNYLGNGHLDRQNMSPVVKAKGNVSIRGNVFIKGDEAPGTSDKYRGQSALLVENGTLNIESNSVLGVYGGGKLALSNNGGNALILENGNVAGDGTLIAVGGNGFWGDGADAVSGAGSISVAKAFLQGGDTYKENRNVGKPYTDNIVIGDTIGKANDGSHLQIGHDTDHPYYWHLIITPPDISIIPFGTEKIISSVEVLQERVETDKDVSIKAILTDGARLVVDIISESNTSSVIKDKVASMEGKKILSSYEVRVENGKYKGNIELSFAVNSKDKKVILLHLKDDNTLEEIEADVVDGRISVVVDSLSPFVVVGNEENKTTEEAQTTDNSENKKDEKNDNSENTSNTQYENISNDKNDNKDDNKDDIINDVKDKINEENVEEISPQEKIKDDGVVEKKYSEDTKLKYKFTVQKSQNTPNTGDARTFIYYIIGIFTSLILILAQTLKQAKK